MEEWIGERWHRFITRAADRNHAAQAVTLDAVQRPVQMLFHSAGGAPGVRVTSKAFGRDRRVPITNRFDGRVAGRVDA